MSIIQIETPSPEEALPLVENALEMEKKLTRDSLRISDERIGMLVQQLETTIEEILADTVPRTEENEQVFLDLEGELEFRRILADTLKHLDQLQICR